MADKKDTPKKDENVENIEKDLGEVEKKLELSDVEKRTSSTDLPDNVDSSDDTVKTTGPDFMERGEKVAANTPQGRDAQEGKTAPEDVQQELNENVQKSLKETEKQKAMQPEDLGDQSQAEKNESGLGARRDGTGYWAPDGSWTQKEVASAASFVPPEDIPDEVSGREVVSDILTAEDREDIATADFTFKGPLAASVRPDQTNPVSDANAEPFMTSYVLYVSRHDGQGQAMFPMRIAGNVDEVQDLAEKIESTGVYFVPDWRRD